MDEEKTVTQSAEAEPVSPPAADELASVAEASPTQDKPVPKQRRKRRTKAEIEADAKKAAAKAKREAKKAVKSAEKAAEDIVDAAEKTAKAAIEDSAKVAAKVAKPRIPTPHIIVQFSGDEINTAALSDAAVAQFRALNKRTKITDIKLYVKPEERAAYYVINGEHTGRVAF